MSQLLAENSRHIGNLRRALLAKRNFGLLVGAGVSLPLGFPPWKTLVKAIARDPRVDGSRVLKREDNNTTTTQTLFQHFRRRQLGVKRKGTRVELPTRENELLIKAEWRELIRKHLYHKNPTRGNFLKRHPYLLQLLEVVKRSRIVVNYNFDDLLEKGLLKNPPDRKKRGFDTTWRFCIQGRSDVPLIYHPNGYLPENLLEGPSEDLVFSEDSFADQLIDSMRGHYSSVLHHLAQNTCMLIGLSLSDPTLKHLLRQHALMHPGHVHYYIEHVPDGAKVNTNVAEAVRDAYFEVYNLVTLFLHDSEIKELLELLIEDEQTLNKKAGQRSAGRIERKFVYYLTGVPGVGKSSTVAHLWALDCYDEWTEERPAILAKKWKDLTKSEEYFANTWIAGQFASRNYSLGKSGEEGIHILDRCPLDPLTFCEQKERGARAEGLLTAIQTEQTQCISGQVFVLVGDAAELEKRARSRHKEADANYFAKMQDALQEVYKGPGVCFIATNGLDLKQVVKQVSKAIHFGDYEQFNCHSKLQAYRRK
jgi:hypothetical protein